MSERAHGITHRESMFPHLFPRVPLVLLKVQLEVTQTGKGYDAAARWDDDNAQAQIQGAATPEDALDAVVRTLRATLAVRGRAR